MEKDAKRLFIDHTHLLEFTFPYHEVQEKGPDLIELCADYEEYELCLFIKELIEGVEAARRNDFTNVRTDLFDTVIEGLGAKKTKSWTITNGETVVSSPSE